MRRKKSRAKFLLGLLLLFFTLTPAQAIGFPIRVKDELNRSVEIPHPPQRIISLAPSVTEILYAIGVSKRVVGVSDHCNYPPEVERRERIGGFATPDLDRIMALKPDLVLAFGTVQIPVVHDLEQRGVQVFWTYPRTIQEILTSFERIGEITGAPVAGKKLRDTVEGQISRVHESLKGLKEQERPGIFRVMGLDPLGTIGGMNFQSVLYRAAGGRNVFEDVKEDFFCVDKEEVKRRNPDVIVICGNNPQRLRQQVLSHEGWDAIAAVHNNRILVISCDLICRPGPRVGETIERVASFLFPDRISLFPQRIVSLVPAVTEELYLLGMQDQIVGVTVYCQRPPEAQSKEKVGTVIDINVEKIMSLRPDLVIASPLTDHKQLRKLQDVGVKVQIIQTPRDFQQICHGFGGLSRLIGKEKAAEDIIKRAEKGLRDITERIQGLPRPRVFLQIGARPLVTAGGDSFINDFVTYAGGVNIASEVATSAYSREEVIRRNPDIILIATMGIAGEKEKEQWRRYTTIKAVKNRRIYTVDSNRFCSPTPLSFVETVQDLTRLFHGGAH